MAQFDNNFSQLIIESDSIQRFDQINQQVFSDLYHYTQREDRNPLLESAATKMVVNIN